MQDLTRQPYISLNGASNTNTSSGTHNGGRSICALRDALLTKLISGEMRVGDAERFVSIQVT